MLIHCQQYPNSRITFVASSGRIHPSQLHTHQKHIESPPINEKVELFRSSRLQTPHASLDLEPCQQISTSNLSLQPLHLKLFSQLNILVNTFLIHKRNKGTSLNVHDPCKFKANNDIMLLLALAYMSWYSTIHQQSKFLLSWSPQLEKKNYSY